MKALFYPPQKINISDIERYKFLKAVQIRMECGNISRDKYLDTLICKDLEIAISPIGCCEITCTENFFNELVTVVLDEAKSMGILFTRLLINEKRTKALEYKNRVIMNKYLQNEVRNPLQIGYLK